MTTSARASTDPVPGQRRAANRIRIRGRLLDSAEQLFADRGYYGVGVREITEQAGTRLAAVSDHFGGKDGLYREVILRRAPLINADRQARLATLPKTGTRSRRLHYVVDAFAQPLLVRSHDSAGWRNYFRLIAQSSTARQRIQLSVADQFNPIAQLFIDQLRLLFPDAADAALHDSYLFMLATTMQVFADNRRIDSVTDDRLHSSDFAQRYASLVRFVVGGITYLARPRRDDGGHLGSGSEP